ncbi:Rne/Rng family ribonuclease [Halalkalibacter hemicellulosilyticus]|uniref:Ribonuclease G n=1 Tax=Halalkalibacter hemicellulosilyticusJCM 9152 TaxID=1236971 RepID=W4QGE1_9BACI|nr:Rne/Rng family ribonuclease [Halalkalibacter hemicellulosilyticus]GAE31156.1 cytoplasmic axial filament protein CafA and Ribonuclease G [Halalkalibacter hemicellulosilyticusJCM 9152]
MKKIVFNLATREKRAALIEDGRVTELMIERTGEERIVHNVYLGRVVKVLPGMQAAFVDIGRDKHGFLYRDDLLSFHLDTEDEEKKKQRPVSKFVREGEELVVQVTKEAFGSKGPRLTGILSFPGHYMIYMPNGNYIGVSRRFSSEAERERWRTFGEELTIDQEGLIIRTSCEGRSATEVTEELHYQRRKWAQLQKRIEEKSSERLLYQDVTLTERIVRDHMFEGLQEIVLDDFDEYKRMKEWLSSYSNSESQITLYKKKEAIFTAYHIEKELQKALKRQVWLKSGAYITIDQTEALTVIDVNTGKFTGKNDFNETIWQTNKEAAKEIVRQLRLRDIAGMIIIDFIDMRREEDRDLIVRLLRNELKKDRTKTNVVGITGLGLVEMTRKKVRQNLQDTLSKPCPTCQGKGVVLSNEAQAFELERQLWEYKGTEHEAIVVELPASILSVFSGSNGKHLKRLESALGVRILLYPNKRLVKGALIRFLGTLEEAGKRLEHLKTN